MKARDKMAYGQYLAGIAFNNASLGYVHAMAHQLGGFYNLPHGVCNAILLPHVEEFNLIGNANRFRDIAKAMGENIDGLSTMEAARKAIAAIRQLSEQVGILMLSRLVDTFFSRTSWTMLLYAENHSISVA